MNWYEKHKKETKKSCFLKKLCNLQYATAYLSKSNCVFFTSIDTSYYFVHKNIKVQLSKKE